MWAGNRLLDVVITSSDGDHVGMADDLELTDPRDGDDVPELTAVLSGPTALGPRLGGRLGLWWSSIGARMRRGGDDYPNRIPVEWLKTVDSRGLELRVPSDEVKTQQLEYWLRDHIVDRIPGHRGSRQ